MSEYYSFEVLGKLAEIEINDRSTHMVVKFDKQEIIDSSGEIIHWGDLHLLNGAAHEQKKNMIMRKTAEEAIASFILSALDDEE